MTDVLSDLQRWVHKKIPMTAFSDLKLVEINDQYLVSEVPLEQNINDKGTLFGGASTMIATISGWLLVKHQMNKNAITSDLVIRKSNIKFIAPIQTETVRFTAYWSDEKNMQEAINQAKKGEQTRISVDVKSFDTNGGTSLLFSAEYVILAQSVV